MGRLDAHIVVDAAALHRVEAYPFLQAGEALASWFRTKVAQRPLEDLPCQGIVTN
jgi:hypothetical protein